MTSVSGVSNSSPSKMIEEYAKRAYQAINRYYGGARPVETPPKTQLPQTTGYVGGFSGHPAFDSTFWAAIKNNSHISGTKEYCVNRPNPTYNQTQLSMGGMSGRELDFVC